ncbi:MAG: transglutaminaseTgpA domain-containing protein [Ruminococcus sp.]|nr:transglutaminaseTgpA domain-containing protein [Ruminococcus sp.]
MINRGRALSSAYTNDAGVQKREPSASYTIKKVIHVLLYSLCSIALVLGLLGCVLTSFNIKEADFSALCWYTAAMVAVFTALSVFIKNSRAFSAVTLCIVAVDIIVLAINRTQLKLSMLNFTNIIARKIHSAYPWMKPVQTEPFNIDVFLICVSVLLSVLMTLFLLRWRRVLPAAIISVIAVMPCYLVRNTPPNAFPLMTCAVILTSLFIVRLYHNKNSDLTPGVLVPAAAIITVAALMIHTISGEPSKWMKELSTAIPGLGGSQATSNTGIDFGSEVDLNKIEDLNLNHLPELRISTDLPDGELYLKDTSFGTFENNTWRIDSGSDWNDNAYLPQEYLGIPGADGNRTVNFAEVTSLIERSNIPHPYRLLTDEAFSTTYDLNRDVSLRRKDGKSDAGSSFNLVTEAEASAAKYWEYAYNNYTSYPGDLMDVTVTDEGLREAVQNGTTSEAVAAAYTYFEQLDGSYSTRVSTIPYGQDYLSWFTKHRQGWCIHYATAAVLVLREMGVPARYVSGYRATFSEEKEDKLNKTLTQQSRHAWAEYYDETLGWRIFDVTPGLDEDNGSVEQQEENGTSPSAEETTATESTTKPNSEVEGTTDAAGNIQPTTIPGENASSPTAPSGADASKPGKSNSAAEKQADTPTDNSFLLIPLFIILALAAIIGGTLLRRKLICDRRHRLLNQRDRTQATIYAYRYLERLLRYLHSEPPEHITSIAEKAKYSRNGNVSHDEWITLRKYLDQSIKALEEHGNALKRFFYRYVICLYD